MHRSWAVWILAVTAAGCLSAPVAPTLSTPTGPLEIGGGVSAPVALETPRPPYPESVRGCVQGVVVLRAVVAEDGTVRDVKVLKGLPLGLTEVAVEAVRRWRYAPARLDGRPVDVYIDLVVPFGWR